jgi:hypothetical protein
MQLALAASDDCSTTTHPRALAIDARACTAPAAECAQRFYRVARRDGSLTHFWRMRLYYPRSVTESRVSTDRANCDPSRPSRLLNRYPPGELIVRFRLQDKVRQQQKAATGISRRPSVSIDCIACNRHRVGRVGNGVPRAYPTVSKSSSRDRTASPVAEKLRAPC